MNPIREIKCPYCNRLMRLVKKRRWDNLYECDCDAGACDKKDVAIFSKIGETSITDYRRQP